MVGCRGVNLKPCLPLPLERYCSADEFNPKEFTFTVLEQPKKKRGRKKQPIVNEVFAFDIETTGIEQIQQSVMYIWQFQIGERLTVFGRTWEEFKWFLVKLRSCLPRGAKAIIFVFNLSYEFQFLKGIYDFKQEELFPIDRRKILYCSMYNCFEFRCAYLQTNMNLKEFTRRMNVKHKKLDDFDYEIPRYPWDNLTVQELRYCQNDVLGLVEALKTEMKNDGDTLLTIPYTSTGYVRRDFRNALKDAGFWYKWADEFFPDPNLYDVMRSAFRGGDTHGNRHYSDMILHDVKSYDRSSSYPDVICNCPFPVQPFVQEKIESIDEIHKMVEQHNRAFLLRLRFTGVQLKSKFWGSPYLSKDKSEHIVNGEFFNGRILSADSLELCITDVDLTIIESTYEIRNMEILECYKSTYGELPECIVNLTIEYYRKKTALKGDDAQRYMYDKSKAKLNSIYGMMATSPVKIPLIYKPEEKDFEYALDKSLDELFSEQKKDYWLPYQYGIWVTAWARFRLFEGCSLVSVTNIGKDENRFSDFVYCDTDSVKFIGDADFTEYNNKRVIDSTISGAFAVDRKGKTHYMGVYEQEHSYDSFKQLGAKKYAGVVDGEMEVTIAGVNKKLGAKELAEHGGLEALENGFTFREAGGLNALYNDIPPVSEWTVDGVKIPITSNVYLYPSEYTLGETADFIRIAQASKKELDLCFHNLYNELCADNARQSESLTEN